MDVELGNRAMYITARNLSDKTEDDFIRSLTRNYHKVAADDVSPGQITAWRDCYSVLCGAFRSLPESFLDLWVVFEYVLPQHAPWTKKFSEETHIRSDVILVSKDTALVLEFKQFEEPYPGAYHQAVKYQTRLKRFHAESNEMRVEAALIVTKASGFVDCFEGVHGCSPDQLPSVLTEIFGMAPERNRTIKQWLDSAFVRNDQIKWRPHMLILA